jgi:hypothetical protein
VDPTEAQTLRAEVQQVPDLDSGGLQVVDELRLMVGGQDAHRLQFEKHLALDKDVSLEVTNLTTSKLDTVRNVFFCS